MRKIKFKKLSIQNFLSIGNDVIEIDFQNGLNLITGTNIDNPERKNGTGKSAIIEAFYYALFGTTIRDIKKEFVVNNVTKGEGKIELTFDVQTEQTTVSYRITRQLKPSKVLLFKMGDEEEDISKDSIANTNKYICDLIGSNPVICKSCDILSLSDNVPFMAKKPEDKRKFIEDIFSLEVFGKMMKELKELIKENKQDLSVCSAKIDEIENSIRVLTSQYETQKRQIEEQVEVMKRREQELNEKVSSVESQIREIVVSDLEEIEKEEKKYSDACALVGRKISELDNQLMKLGFEKTSHEKDYKRFSSINGAECDKCMQKIGGDHIEHIESMKKTTMGEIEKIDEKLRVVKEEREKFVKKQTQCSQKIREFSLKISQVRADMQKRDNLNKLLEEHKQSLVNLKADSRLTVDSLNVFLKNVEEAKERKEVQEKVFEELKMKSDDYETAKFILGEEGVKSFIIKNLLDMLNATIQKYITSLGMTMRCKFDEYFDEKITNDRGVEISYWNFSGGERRTVDLACAWSFKDIKRKIAGVSSNVEFLDEIFDSAFDERGMDLLIEVLKERIEKNNMSCYSISHRKETMKHIDGEIVNLEKENGITRRTQETS